MPMGSGQFRIPTQQSLLLQNVLGQMAEQQQLKETTGISMNPSPLRLGQTALMASIASSPPVTDQDTLQGMLQLRDRYAASISATGEEQTRREIAHRQRARQISEFNDYANEVSFEDPELAGTIREAADIRLIEDEENRAAYALEQEFVRSVMNTAADDPYQAQLMLDNLREGDALDVMADRLTRSMILQREIDNLGLEAQDRPWFYHLADFALSAVPFLESTAATGNVDVNGVTTNWYDWLLSGERIRNEREALWTMPLDEFVDYVPNTLIPNLRRSATDLGYFNQGQVLRLAANMQHAPDAWETNAFNALDNFGVLALAGRGVLSIPGAMAQAGARREAVRLVAGLADEVANEGAEAVATRYGVTVDEIERLTLPRAVNPHGGAGGVSFAAGAAEAQERGQILLRMLTNLTATSRLDPVEMQAAIQSATRSLTNRFGNRVADDVSVERITLADQSTVNRVTVTVGRQDGLGFARRGNAENYARSVGLDPEDVVQDPSGQWFARARADVNETGFFARNLESPIAGSSFGWLHRGILSSRGLGDRLLTSAGLQAGGRQNRLIRALGSTYSRVFSSLPAQERKALGQVLRLGETEGKWFTRGELDEIWNRTFDRSPTQREVRAYQAAVDVNDIEYALRNDDVYKSFQTRGFSTVSFDTGMGVATEMNGQVRRSGIRVGADSPRMYDVTNRQHILTTTQEAVDDLLGQGYVVIDLDRALELVDGTRVTRFIGRESDFNVQSLRRQQLAYRPGGHRMYQGQYFVKQANIYAQPDQAGSQVFDQPSTFIVAKTRRQAQEWAEVMEQARRAVNDNPEITAAELDNIFAGRAGFPTGEEFLQHLDDGVYRRDTPFEALFDREMPTAYSPEVARRLESEDNLPGYGGWLRTTGRMYYGGKGEHLRDYRGELAPVYNPFRTINTSLSNIARLTSFSDFKHAAIQRWVNTYRHTLEQQGLEGMSDMAIFQRGRVSDTLPNAQKVRQAAEGERDVIRRILNWETEGDRRMRLAARAASEYVEGVFGEPGANFINWMNDSRPFSAIRGFVFDIKLGMFNVAQLPLQTSTMFAAMYISPRAGMQGFLAMPMVQRILMGNGKNFNGMVEQFIRNGAHKNLGMDAAEFRAYLRHARDSGIYDVNGTHIMVNDYGPTAAFGRFGQGVQDIREAGRFFFYQAEVMNRIVARHIAWKRIRNEFQDLEIGSPEFNARVAGLTDDYSMNMMRESRSAWQDGLLSIPTQFWAYNARMLEMMLGKRLTPMQRVRLAAGQLFMYGSSGIALAPVVSDVIKSRTGEPELNTPLGFLDRGFFDHLIYNLPMIGEDVRFGERVGTGTWSAELVREIFGMSQYGETSLADMVGGASYQIVSGLVGDVRNYLLAEMGIGDTVIPRGQAIRSMLSEVSSISNAWKAYLVFRYGTYETGSGSTIVSDLPPHHAIYTLLSYQPGEAGEIGDLMDFYNRREEHIADAARIQRNYLVRMLNRPEDAEQIRAEMLEWQQLLPEDIRPEIIRQSRYDVDESLYQGMAERIEEQRLEINRRQENERRRREAQQRNQ